MPEDMKTVPVSGRGRSRKKRKVSPIYYILLSVFAVVMLFSGYKLISGLMEYRKAQDTYEDIQKKVISTTAAQETTQQQSTTVESKTEESSSETQIETSSEEESTTEESTEEEIIDNPPESIDFVALQQAYPDVIAWIYGQGGVVNYPIMQCADNDYYLYRLPNGVSNDSGSLFLDFRNNFLRDDYVDVIYGHHMKDGSMFGSLKEYVTPQAQSYYKKYPCFYLYTPEGKYKLDIFASRETTSYEQPLIQFYDKEDFTDIVIKEYMYHSSFQSSFVPQFGDQIVCLYTCAYHVNNGRLLIFCVAHKME